MSARKLARVLQFRFRTLFLTVAFVAIGVAALINATPAWSHDLFFAAVALLTVAIPLACYRTGEQRAFWAGFALCGWVYLLMIGNVGDRPRADRHIGFLPLAPGPSIYEPTSRLTLWVYQRAYGQSALADQADWQTLINVNTGQVSQRLRQYELAYLAQTELAMLASGDSGNNQSGASAGGTSRATPAWRDFLNVGHALWTIVLACAGGLIVRGIYILRPEEKS